MCGILHSHVAIERLVCVAEGAVLVSGIRWRRRLCTCAEVHYTHQANCPYLQSSDGICRGASSRLPYACNMSTVTRLLVPFLRLIKYFILVAQSGMRWHGKYASLQTAFNCWLLEMYTPCM